MARGNNQNQSVSARSEIASQSRSVALPWENRGDVVPSYVAKDIEDKRKTTLENISNAQDYLKKKDDVALMSILGGKDKYEQVKKDVIDSGIISREKILDVNRINYQKNFNDQLKKIGNVVVNRNDADLIKAVNNYYNAQKKGELFTEEVTGQGGNGYSKRFFYTEYNKEQKGWEIKRELVPLLYTGDPNDFGEEKGWFILKGSKTDNVARQKAEKISVILKEFVED